MTSEIIETDDYSGPDRRCAPHHTWRWRLLSAWIVVFSLLVIFAIHDLAHTRQENCRRVSTVLEQIVLASDKSLGHPGSPGYAYYHVHPEELRQAHLANRRLIDKLNPKKCG